MDDAIASAQLPDYRMSTHEDFMQRAIDLARMGMQHGDGGPFGCVIVRDGTVIGEGWNRVLVDSDPTAHGEVVAIRAACRAIKQFSLQGATLYTTGKPCPMCLGAILWARIEKIYYGFDGVDAASVGFDDSAFYREIALPEEQRAVPAAPLMRRSCLRLLDEYRALPDRTPY